MKKTYLVDANVIVRMLRGDHAEHSPLATALFFRAESGEFSLEITEVTVAEVVWVLASFYKVTRHSIADTLLKLLANPGVTPSNSVWLRPALESYRDTNIDATDCFLAAFSISQRKPLISFDRDFRKFRSLEWLTPDKI